MHLFHSILRSICRSVSVHPPKQLLFSFHFIFFSSLNILHTVPLTYLSSSTIFFFQIALFAPHARVYVLLSPNEDVRARTISKNKIKSKLVLNSFSGLGSSRRHLQSGNSLSGSLHYGINSDDDILPIPQPPLPPTSVPPHLIINCTDDLDDDDMDDDVDDGDDGDMAEMDDVDDEELAAAISNEQHHSIHHHHHQQQQQLVHNNMIGNPNLQDDIFFSGSNDRFINVDSV